MRSKFSSRKAKRFPQSWQVQPVESTVGMSDTDAVLAQDVEASNRYLALGGIDRAEVERRYAEEADGRGRVNAYHRMLAEVALTRTTAEWMALGVGNVFGSFLESALRNPAAADGQQGRLFIGFAAAELLGLLAFVVATLTYITSPTYIALLWLTFTGKMMLCVSAIWMTFGILVMRKMINFDF